MLLSSSNLHPIDPCGLFHIERDETRSESIFCNIRKKDQPRDVYKQNPR
jgi:hypothetical protein